MKKILFSALVGAMIISCSRDNDNTNPTTPQTPATNEIGILPVRITSSSNNSIDIEATYTYNGNKLVKEAFNDGSERFYTYTGDLITSINENENENDGRLYHTFIYDSNDNLISEKEEQYEGTVKIKENYTAYTINGSTVTAQKISKRYNNSDGTLSSTITSTITYTLNTKKRPIKYTIVSQKVGTMENVSLNGTYTYFYNNYKSIMENVKGIDKLAYSSSAIGLEYYTGSSREYSGNYLLSPLSYIKREESVNSTIFPYNHNSISEDKIVYTLNTNNYPIRAEYKIKNPITGQYEDTNHYYTIEYNK